MTDKHEEMWSKMYTLLVVRTFLFAQTAPLHRVLQHFQLAPPLSHCLDSALTQLGAQLGGAVGLHLRLWRTDVSLINEPCARINKYNPLKLIYQCDLQFGDVRASIARVRQGKEAVFLATDDRRHGMVDEVKASYQVRSSALG